MHDNEYDRLINNKWKAANLPIPSDENAMRGARMIYKKAMKRPWKGKTKIVHASNMYTWIRRGTLVVNPNRPDYWQRTGWADIVHLLSHWCHSELRPNERPHSRHQMELEKELTNYVLSDSFKKYY